MLRQNKASGEIMALGAYCGGDAGMLGESCYVDERVPAGTYRYGYQTPKCCHTCCGAYYYTEVAVPTDPSPSCTRTSDTCV